MENKITELVFILDRSGSMAGLEADTIGGFNAMIEKQKKQCGGAYVTTVLFDNESTCLHDRIDIACVPKMTDGDYTVGGCTALLDAIGDAVTHISDIHKYARTEDIPSRTMFVITTDGQENASHKYNSETVKRLISQKKEEKGWEFLFIGANIDAVETASRYGIDASRAVNYNADSKGTKIVFEAVANAIGSVRSSKKLDKSWSKEIEADYRARSAE